MYLIGWVGNLNHEVQYFVAILVDNLDRAPETVHL